MYDDNFKEAVGSLMSYCKKHMGYDKDPDVHFVTDKENASNLLGLTAHYQPDKKIVTVFITKRHPKDALRSLAHELVHHNQNVQGKLSGGKFEEGYAQDDIHMRKMEKEAYLKGNMMFRDWSDHCKKHSTYNINSLGEQKMSNEEMLRQLVIEKVRSNLIAEGYDPKELDEGLLDMIRGAQSSVKGAVAGGKAALSGMGSRAKASATVRGRGLKQALTGVPAKNKAIVIAAADPKQVRKMVAAGSDLQYAFIDIGGRYNQIAKRPGFQELSKLDPTTAARIKAGFAAAQSAMAEVLSFIVLGAQLDPTGASAKAIFPSLKKMQSKMSANDVRREKKDFMNPGAFTRTSKKTGKVTNKVGGGSLEEEFGEDLTENLRGFLNALLNEEDTDNLDEKKNSKPDFPDVDGDGDRKEPISKASKEKEKKPVPPVEDDDDKEEKGEKKNLDKVPPQLRKHVAKKVKEHNELRDVKKSQGSINKLNETRLLNVNKALMERLIK
tara:strand:+ start:14632 stop:16119 length:1488 start_codon:yes stop_codon:yes gene_type:complete